MMKDINQLPLEWFLIATNLLYSPFHFSSYFVSLSKAISSIDQIDLYGWQKEVG